MGRDVAWIRFANRTGEAIELHWIGTDGVAHFHAAVPPGLARTQAAVAGQVWATVDASGTETGRYHADPQARYVEIAPPSSLGPLLPPLPAGFAEDEAAFGVAGRERVLSSGRPIMESVAAALDAHDGGEAVFRAGNAADGGRCQLAVFAFPDEERARAFAEDHMRTYEPYLNAYPSAGRIEIPDGYGVRGLFSRSGGGASGWVADGAHVFRATVVTDDTERDAATVREVLASRAGAP